MAKKTASSKVSRKVASRKKKPLKRNPSPAQAETGIISHTWAELATMAAPGLVGYAAVRGAGWLAYRIASAKSPGLAKHAGPLASIAAAVGASYATRKYESLEKYDLPIVVGAWIAAIQSVAQTYLPALSWPLGDWNMLAHLQKQKRTVPMASKEDAGQIESVENYGREYADAFDDNSSSASLPPASTSDDDYADIPGLNDEGMSVGIFAGGFGSN